MLKRVAVNEEFSWLVVVDDDTLLRYIWLILHFISKLYFTFSIPRLVDFLGCHDDKSYSIFGEMYGYKAYHTNGYLYPTGGAGLVIIIINIHNLHFKKKALSSAKELLILLSILRSHVHHMTILMICSLGI